jgi:hypothetical protein
MGHHVPCTAAPVTGVAARKHNTKVGVVRLHTHLGGYSTVSVASGSWGKPASCLATSSARATPPSSSTRPTCMRGVHTPRHTWAHTCTHAHTRARAHMSGRRQWSQRRTRVARASAHTHACVTDCRTPHMCAPCTARVDAHPVHTETRAQSHLQRLLPAPHAPLGHLTHCLGAHAPAGCHDSQEIGVRGADHALDLRTTHTHTRTRSDTQGMWSRAGACCKTGLMLRVHAQHAAALSPRPHHAADRATPPRRHRKPTCAPAAAAWA